MIPVQFTPFALPYYLATIISAIITVYAFQQGRKHGFNDPVLAFTTMEAIATIWVLCVALEYSITDQWLKTVLGIGRIVGALTPVLFIVFTLLFAGHERFVTRRYVTLLLVVPVASIILAVTNWYHGLMWSASSVVEYGGALFLYREFTTAFYVPMLYGAVLVLIGSTLLLKLALTSQRLYRRQAIAVAGGMLVLITSLIVWFVVELLFEFSPPLITLAFPIKGALFGYALFRFRFLDIVPVARDTVVDNMRDGYLVTDPSGRIVDVNDAGQALLDRTASDIVGNHLDALFPNDEGVLDGDDHATRTEHELTVETASDDPRFLIAHRTDLTRPEHDHPLGQLVILRDITNRRRVQKRYQTLIEHSSDLTVVLDEEGDLTYVSPSAKSIIGVPADEIIGENTMDHIHPEDIESVAERFDEVVMNPAETVRFEYRLRHIDGSWRTMEGVARNLLENPYVKGVVVNARDITARTERERDLERTNDRLEQFANIVSHDLRNPLTVAQGHLQLAKDTGDMDSLEAIEQSHERMESIIEDVLTLAQQEKSIGETEHVGLASIAREAWKHVETPDATLVVDSNTTIAADRDRLLRLFENCFRNAIEHAGADVTVTIGTTDKSFFIADDGPGIPDNQRDDVLEAGYTTAETGTGFGLSIVSQIAEAHGWTVSIDTSVAGGARLSFRTEEFDDLSRPVPNGQRTQ